MPRPICLQSNLAETLRGGGNFTIQDSANVNVSGNFDLNNGIVGGGTTSNNIISLNGGTLSVNAFTKITTETTKQSTLNLNGTLVQGEYERNFTARRESA